MTEWWKKATIYQIYPRSFMDSNGDGIGDLRGILQKLDYLEDLGIDMIWLSPVYDSPNDDYGYDVRNYTEILGEFGTMADFDELLKEIHQRGMKLMMDLIVNHTSDEHEWFRTRPDFYIWRDQPNNWQSFFGGSAWEYSGQRKQYYLHLFSKKQPDLNWANEEVRQAVHKMVRWWLDKGVDGFRMDVINMIAKHPNFPDGPDGDGRRFFINQPAMHRYLREMHENVFRQYEIVTVGETPNTSAEEARVFTDPGNRELNMVFAFDHVRGDQGPEEKWEVRPLPLTELKRFFEQWQHTLKETGWNTLYWENHDQPRIVSRYGNDEKYRVESAKMLAACLFFMQGTPFIYQGQELGMTNVRFPSITDYRDIEILNMYKEKRAEDIPHETIMEGIYAKGRDNARTPMHWSADRYAGFTTGVPWIGINPNYQKINAEQAMADPDSVYAYYKSLIRLRKTLDIVTWGDFSLLYPGDEEVFAYKRSWEAEELAVYCNFSEAVRTFPRPSGSRLTGNYAPSAEGEEVLLRPYEAIVYYEKEAR